MANKREKTTHTKCAECGFQALNGKKLTFHISSAHGMKAEDYTAKYLYDDERPLCPACGQNTRYVAFTFNSYCKDHSYIAESKGGKKGGQAPAWNHGLTKETDERVATQALNITGEKNHFYGRKHTDTTKRKISITQRARY